jgi:hypothetical protein
MVSEHCRPPATKVAQRSFQVHGFNQAESTYKKLNIACSLLLQFLSLLGLVWGGFPVENGKWHVTLGQLNIPNF